MDRADNIFSEFVPLAEEALKKLALACKKSCALDPLPSSTLTVRLDELLPVITKMVNHWKLANLLMSGKMPWCIQRFRNWDLN